MTSRGVDLYRRILRAHKALPSHLKILGNAYVRSEFHLHKKVTSEKELQIFFTAWEKYLHQVMLSQEGRRLGRDLSSNEAKHLSDEQREKLEELRREAANQPTTP
eukprot:gene16383-18580_t